MNRFSHTTSLTQALIKQSLAPLIGLFSLGVTISIIGMDSLTSISAHNDMERVTLQLSLGLWDMFEAFLVFLILCRGIPHVRHPRTPSLLKTPFATPYMNSLLGEYFRQMAQTLLWTLALLLPGLYRYSQLIYMPLIAIFCAPYREDKVDALKLSAELSRKNIFLIASVLVATSLLAFGLEYLPNFIVELHTPPIRVLCSAASFYVGIWSFSFFYLLFEEAMEKHQWT